MKTTKIVFIIFLFMIMPLMAGQFSMEQRETGELVLKSLSVKDGRFSFRAESGGCTDKRSFKVNVEKGAGISEKIPNYIITVIRTAPDDCKALLDEGVVIEYDLEKDLGLRGYYTVTVKNMVLPR